jgi:hypothetical protein
MRGKILMDIRYATIPLVALLAAACTDAVPTGIMAPTSDAPLFAVVGKPPIDQTLEGEAWVCKDGSGPATNFTFAVSVNGAAATNQTVALGTCVQVASVPTNVINVATISVTEVAIPQDWSLTSIVIESNSGSSHQPVINPPNASARISHDFGVVFTFTNTFTPPPPPPPPGPACTFTQGFWKNHTELWDEVADGKPFLSTTTFYNSGVSYITIMNTPPKGGNAYLQLAHQFIAASLNVNGAPSGDASADAALAGAAAYFAGAPAGIPNPSGSLRTQLQGWATTLDNYNNGLIGPGHCPN